jgi:hypothetical protein
MIVIIPITLIVPAMFVFIPPSVAMFPAPFSGFTKLMSPVFRLSAVVTVLFNGTVQLMIRVNQFLLARVACIRSWRPCQEHTPRKDRCAACNSGQAHFPSMCTHVFIRLLR